MEAFYQWIFTVENFKAIQVIDFTSSPIDDNTNATFMMELYSIFEKIIDDNPSTSRNFEGKVDEATIRELCLSFKRAIEEISAKYEISQYVRPQFIVYCVAFA